MSHPTPEEAELLINENRFLKQTIITLREELTKKEFETQDIIDGKQSDFQKESKVLKSIIEKQGWILRTTYRSMKKKNRT